MPENNLVTVAACGLAVVCVGVTLIGALLVLRLTGQVIMGRDDAGTGRMRLLRPRRSRPNLQAQADALDFDAALAQAATLRDQPATSMPLPPVEVPPLNTPNRVIPPWEDEPPGFFPDEADSDDV